MIPAVQVALFFKRFFMYTFLAITTERTIRHANMRTTTMAAMVPPGSLLEWRAPLNDSEVDSGALVEVALVERVVVTVGVGEDEDEGNAATVGGEAGIEEVVGEVVGVAGRELLVCCETTFVDLGGVLTTVNVIGPVRVKPPSLLARLSGAT
jgi:hypothetical protein